MRQAQEEFQDNYLLQVGESKTSPCKQGLFGYLRRKKMQGDEGSRGVDWKDRRCGWQDPFRAASVLSP